MNSKTVLLAAQGDSEALETVLKQLDGCIERMCTRRRITESGRYVYEPDLFMKGEMQQKLLIAILKFIPEKDSLNQ